MGDHVLRAVESASDMRVVGALECAGHARLGEEIAPGVTLGSDPVEALAKADVAIDFSLPEGSIRLLEAAADRGIPAVSGTTGFSAEQRARIDDLARKVPLVLAPNFSLGINVLLEVVAGVARRLHDYHVEVLELHHALKADAPSGTALRLAEAIAEARELELSDHKVLHREGHTGPRPANAIGLQTLRAGDAVGEHTVLFAGPGERLELTHRALSRGNFAEGSVRAARWVVGRSPGLYSMGDVLSSSSSNLPRTTGAA
jgi:4-hydroxy-tetrahydrodipicolinate reductase